MKNKNIEIKDELFNLSLYINKLLITKKPEKSFIDNIHSKFISLSFINNAEFILADQKKLIFSNELMRKNFDSIDKYEFFEVIDNRKNILIVKNNLELKDISKILMEDFNYSYPISFNNIAIGCLYFNSDIVLESISHFISTLGLINDTLASLLGYSVIGSQYTFLMNNYELFFELDSDLNVVDLNRQAVIALQSKKEVIIGKHIVNFVREENTEFLDFIHQVTMKRKFQKDIKLITSKKRTIYFKTTGLLTPYNHILIFANNTTLYNTKLDLLSEKVNKYRAMYENAPLAYQSLNPDGNIIDVNPMWLITLGYTKSEVIGRNFSDFLDNDYVAHFKKNFPVFKAQGYIHDVRFRMVRKDKSKIYVSFEGCIGYRADGIMRQTYCTFKDITTEFMMEKELRESKIRYQSMFQKSYSIMLIIDPITTDIIDANDAACNYYQYSHDEMLKLKICDLNTNALKNVRNDVNKALNNDKNIFHFKHKKSNGEIRDVEVYSGKIYIRSKEYLYSIIHDISKRIKAEEERKLYLNKMKNALELNKSILTNASQGIIVYDTKLRYLLWNKFMETFTGLSESEVLGKTTAEIFDQSTYDKIRHGLEEALKGNRITYENVEFYNPKKKQWGISQEIFSPNIDSDGNIIGVICIISDVTGIVNSKKELEKKNEEYIQLNKTLNKNMTELEIAKDRAEQSDRLKTAFLTNMSHEIRTPLNAIVGFADLFDASLSAEELKTYSEIIKRNNEILLKLISDIIDYSRIEADIIEVDLQEFDISQVLEELHSTYKTRIRDNLRIKLEYLPENFNIQTDKYRLVQVFVNILNNAFKFTECGEISFGIIDKNTSHTTFFVRDTGCGIKKEHFNKIFEKFYQIDSIKQGTGLGLSISKALLEKLNGKIWLESEINVGSTFYFKIPNKHRTRRNIYA